MSLPKLCIVYLAAWKIRLLFLFWMGHLQIASQFVNHFSSAHPHSCKNSLYNQWSCLCYTTIFCFYLNRVYALLERIHRCKLELNKKIFLSVIELILKQLWLAIAFTYTTDDCDWLHYSKQQKKLWIETFYALKRILTQIHIGVFESYCPSVGTRQTRYFRKAGLFTFLKFQYQLFITLASVKTELFFLAEAKTLWTNKIELWAELFS